MNLHPAFLFTGPQEACIQKATDLISQSLCKKQGCYACVDCKAIQARQHYLLLWLNPETSYTLSHLEAVFTVTSFALQPNEQYFIVFQRADLFNQATANSLLKLLEEPPLGYHFILLAQRPDSLLETIVSRCIVEALPYQEELLKHPLYRFFTTFESDFNGDFSKELERQKSLERDVVLFLDQIALFWHEQLLLAVQSGNDKKYRKLFLLKDLIEKSRTRLPLAVHAKFFFKNLYLQFLTILSS